MTRVRESLLIVAYVLLVIVVVSGAFFIPRQFHEQHKDDCSIARAFADIAAVATTAIIDTTRNVTAAQQETATRLLNRAIDELNSTCDFQIPPITVP